MGNLPKTFQDAYLRQLFEGFGAIVSHKIMNDTTTGVSKGFGFVQFADPASATGALNVMNGFEVEGRVLLVKPADRNAGEKAPPRTVSAPMTIPMSVPMMAQAPMAAASDNIYVGGIPLHWTEAELNVFFGTYGTILSSIVLKDKTTNKSRGSAMVRYADVNTATAAVQTLNGQPVEGSARPLEVKFADKAEEKNAKRTAAAVNAVAGGQLMTQRFDPYRRTQTAQPLMQTPFPQTVQYGNLMPPASLPVPTGAFSAPQVNIPKRYESQPEEGTNLHVAGLDKNLTDLHLYQAFAGFGAINSVRVMVDPTGLSKGYGFVQFMRAMDAQTAMLAVDGTVVGTKAWVVTPHKKKTG